MLRLPSLTLALALFSGCPGPSVDQDASIAQDVGPDATRDGATDAGHDAEAPPPDAAIDGDATDSGDASTDAADAPDVSCAAAGFVCVALATGACTAPNITHPTIACGTDELCCEPATGVPADCASSAGACTVHDLAACPPPRHFGEPEIYLCDPGTWCCLPPPPDPSCMRGALPLPDGTECAPASQCFDGHCLPVDGTCGDGVRDPDGTSREACDDGDPSAGGACDASCHAVPLIAASRPGRSDVTSAQVPSLAADQTGRLLLVWLADRVVAGEITRDLLAQRYSSGGVAIDASPFVLESDLGTSQPVHPALTGLSAGWAVVWHSTRIEGGAAGASDGGVALAIVGRDVGATTLRANTTVRFDQREPVVVAVDAGIVVVWSDASRDGVRGELRMRAFDESGTATLGEASVAAASGEDASGPFVVGRGRLGAPSGRWAVAWTTRADMLSLPQVRLRRFDGMTALDAADLALSSDWATTPSLAATSDGVYAAWTSRASDSRGDVAVRFVADASATSSGPPDAIYTAADAGALHFADELPAIAPFPEDGSAGYVLLFRTMASPVGGRLVASPGVTMPLEMSHVAELVGAGQSGLSMTPTVRGLWFVWTDPTTSAVSSVQAYLAPWS